MSAHSPPRRPLLVRLLSRGFAFRHRLALLTRAPVLGPVLDRLLFDGDELYYLPREESISMGRDLGQMSSLVMPPSVIEHFIDAASHFFIMDFCICRESAKCTDYPRDLGCLFLGEAAQRINPSLGRAATREEAREHVARCRQAGLVHLVGRNKLDAVWLGTGPPERLMTICNCCPCCCLWMMLPSLAPAIQGKVSRMPGVSVAVTEECTGCGICTSGTCFVGAITLQDGVATISDACRGCGRCVGACPHNAIVLSLDPRATGDVIRRLGETVSV